MKRFFLIVAAIVSFDSVLKADKVDSIPYGSFGKIYIYHPEKVPGAFVIFISGDAGWKEEVISKAKNMVTQGAMVVGIDINRYYRNIKASKSKCIYLAGDLEDMSMTIQKKNKFSQYQKPLLVGYSSGSTLAYGALAQAPANTFKGVLALSFFPDAEISKPFCKGSGLEVKTLKEGKLYYFNPNYNLTAPFIILNGTEDLACKTADIEKYIDKMQNTELIKLPKVGHGFKVAKNWLPQFMNAYNRILKQFDEAAQKQAGLQLTHAIPLNNQLPLIITQSAVKGNLPIAFFISGDGGWTSFDQGVSDKLAEKGISVIGLDAQKYFWEEKNPQQTAKEISLVVEHFMQRWDKNSFVLVGYSFGACVAPFIANDFADSLKNTLKGVYCFSPDATGDFEIMSWICSL